MTGRIFAYKSIFKIAVIAVVLLLVGWLALQLWNPWGKATPVTVDALSLFNTGGTTPFKSGLPLETAFAVIAENKAFKLLADKTTAHFQIVDKSTGKLWRSYPDPEHWAQEKVPLNWKNQLSSPITIEFVNAKNYKSSSVTSGLADSQGYLEQFQTTADGFTVTFAFPKAEIKIPIAVSLQDGYVETRLIDSGIVEGNLSLLNVRLYPLFGAQPSVGQDGYILLPDGSGSIIQFQQDRVLQQLTYNESVYGQDLSFFNENTGRQRIAMPVYGLKSGDQAFVAIISEGEAFANIFAAPSGAVGLSNWVTTEWKYRKRFFQSVSKSTGDGFYTYSGEKFITDSRATRYYPIAPEKSDYVGMAGVYRQYLIGEKGVAPLASTKKDIPLVLDIIGADIEKGLFFDSYLKATTTDEAAELVKNIYDSGIQNLRVHYTGWQQDGYSTHGDYFPVDKRIGGNKGMKKFIDFAHSIDIPVYLTANYSLNTNGEDGFWWRRDGQRNLAGTVLEWWRHPDQEPAKVVSPGFYEKVIDSDLNKFKELGADGIYYEDGIGKQVNTDFNTRYAASRSDVIDIQQRILTKSKEQVGSVVVKNANFYALDQIDYVYRLTGDYSYDVFISEAVPFAQIVLHGLRPYSLEWSNVRDEWEEEFLRSIEYGAYPTYVLSGDKAEDLRRSYSIWYYSLNYKDWTQHISEEYRRSNEALVDVQNEYITAHRTLAPGVKETEYGGNYRVIVNYNESEFNDEGLTVPARDFVVVKGGTNL
ncbi:hypothetical protein I6N90_06290 [Paenibacillus sp. GSMTC-2017]|uniref:DUF5696 domain-containing protein n=1 Tax=Paenibacillus sp. GSMTC-2017 TaxID=2794350 RepID=UPI0018D62067|nr:DUF5696 domain-containing protein [Paenibacillus sp. GSMTC-2017]MBH5317422.1 hypothetical protein [Paenibacillus sp. GSMTC-2017]